MASGLPGGAATIGIVFGLTASRSSPDDDAFDPLKLARGTPAASGTSAVWETRVHADQVSQYNYV
ncbi:hypothetical protein DIPPA_32502 [Diplonema papillatum]|nr:hypothetical protein DIPPA_32502 [Diplonema papillatum]